MEKAKHQAEVLKDKSLEVELQLKVLKVDKCHYIEDCRKEVLILQNKREIAVINLTKIQSLLDKKIIQPSTKIDLKFLKSQKLIKKMLKNLKY